MDVCNDSTGVGNDYMCVDRKFGPKADSERWLYKGGTTHVEDMKNPVEDQFPAGDLFLIVRRMDKSGDRIPPAVFDDLPLDLRHSPAIKSVCQRVVQSDHHRFDSRRQLCNRLAYRLTEVIQLPPIHSTVESFTCIGTG